MVAPNVKLSLKWTGLCHKEALRQVPSPQQPDTSLFKNAMIFQMSSSPSGSLRAKATMREPGMPFIAKGARAQ